MKEINYSSLGEREKKGEERLKTRNAKKKIAKLDNTRTKFWSVLPMEISVLL